MKADYEAFKDKFLATDWVAEWVERKADNAYWDAFDAADDEDDENDTQSEHGVLSSR